MLVPDEYFFWLASKLALATLLSVGLYVGLQCVEIASKYANTSQWSAVRVVLYSVGIWSRFNRSIPTFTEMAFHSLWKPFQILGTERFAASSTALSAASPKSDSEIKSRPESAIYGCVSRILQTLHCRRNCTSFWPSFALVP
jgi:hypothetical protein